MKVLIIDDDRHSLDVCRLIVSNCGHEPVTLSDATQALKVIADEHIQVVICDWVLPGLSALDLVRALRANSALRPYVYFIVLTGIKLGKINFMEAMDAGADDYMEKPEDRDLFRVRLRVAQRILKLDTEVNALKSILPICSHCKRVRRDDEAYENIETYFTKNYPLRFSHGVCAECLEKYYRKSR